MGGILGAVGGAQVGWERGLGWMGGVVLGGVVGAFGGGAAGGKIGSILGTDGTAALRRLEEALPRAGGGALLGAAVFLYLCILAGGDGVAWATLYLALGATSGAIAVLLNAWMQYEPADRAMSIRRALEHEGLNASLNPFREPEPLVADEERARHECASALALNRSFGTSVGFACGTVAGTSIGLGLDGRVGAIVFTLVGWLAGGVLGAILSDRLARTTGDIIETWSGGEGPGGKVGIRVGVAIGVVGGLYLARWAWGSEHDSAAIMPAIGMKVGTWLGDRFGWY